MVKNMHSSVGLRMQKTASLVPAKHDGPGLLPVNSNAFRTQNI